MKHGLHFFINLHNQFNFSIDCFVNTSPSSLSTLFQDFEAKLTKVTMVRKDLESHIQNLPDLTLLPDVTGGLAPLPSAGDLFSI